MSRKFVVGVLAGLLCASSLRADEGLTAKVLKDLKSATVYVKLKVNGADLFGGSGFVFRQDGNATLIATNEHVVQISEIYSTAPIPAEVTGETRKRLLEIRQQVAGGAVEVSVVFGSGTKDEQILPAEIVAKDAEHDLAILRVQGVLKTPVPIPFEKPQEIHETMGVFALGFPFGSSLGIDERNPAVTVTKGSVSAIRQDEQGQSSYVQIDGSINPGNSGGPIVDPQGRLVAIAVATIRGSGIGIGIPAEQLGNMLQGSVGRIELKARHAGEDKAEVDVRVHLIDPLNKIRSVTLNYMSGEPSAQMIDKNKPAVALPNSQKLTLTREGQFAVGKFTAPVVPKSPLQLTVQASFTNAGTVVMHPQPYRDDFAGTDRRAFVYVSVDAKSRGRIAWNGREWIEVGETQTNKGVKRSTAAYKESTRTDEYVELFHQTGRTLRLYPDRISYKLKSGGWETSLHGAWTKPTDAEAQLASTQPAAPKAAPGAAPGAPAPGAPGTPITGADRKIWVYVDQPNQKVGAFKLDGANWVEDSVQQRGRRLTTKNRYTFREVSRNDEYIEMIDGRNVSVRLYSDRADVKATGEEWHKIYSGSWQAPAGGAATTPGAPAPSAPAGATQVAGADRKSWKYVDNQNGKVGAFRLDGANWVEEYQLNKGANVSKQRFTFREASRNDDYIELIDNRNIGVRLYKDHADVKATGEQWHQLCSGSWEAPAGAAVAAGTGNTGGAVSPAAAGGESRSVWKFENQKNASGSFTKTADGWTESKEMKLGRVTRRESVKYSEKDSTADYIELADQRRSIGVRLYKDHSERRIGQGSWVRDITGSWSEAK